MSMDPRAENCRGYRVEGGLVLGVEIDVRANPIAKYELVSVKLIDEKTQGPGGPTIAFYTVLDAAGRQTFDGNVMLAWPWPDSNAELPPGTPGQHMITNGYVPPNRGPLEIRIEDAGGNIISDRVGGFGLPNNHHVSYQLLFQERGGTVIDPPDDPETEPDNAEVVAVLMAIRDDLRALRAHLGA